MLAMRTRAATSHAMAALRWGRAGPYLVREVRRFGSERHAPLRLEPVLDALGTHRSNQDPLGTHRPVPSLQHWLGKKLSPGS